MKITKSQLKQIIKEELSRALKLKESIGVDTWDKFTYGGMTEDKNDPAYKRGRKDGKAGKNKQAGMKAEKARPNGSVKKYEQGWLSGHEIAETGGD